MPFILGIYVCFFEKPVTSERAKIFDLETLKTLFLEGGCNSWKDDVFFLIGHF